ncbi:myosin I [Saccharomyces pastorianus]|nr:myosin I [Saccharomyces pastorianus]
MKPHSGSSSGAVPLPPQNVISPQPVQNTEQQNNGTPTSVSPAANQASFGDGLANALAARANKMRLESDGEEGADDDEEEDDW